MKLLIVDDNSKIREMLKDMFSENFTEIRECQDGIESLDAYKEFLPDWVFMDVKMKKMDGITATKNIKKSYPNAKILVVTDYNDIELKKQALSGGALGYVLKENVFEIYNYL